MQHVYYRGPDAAARDHWGGSHPVSSGHAHAHAQPAYGSRSAWRQGWMQSAKPERMDYPQGEARQELHPSVFCAAKDASSPRAADPDPPLAAFTQGPVPTAQTSQAGTPVHERARVTSAWRGRWRGRCSPAAAQQRRSTTALQPRRSIAAQQQCRSIAAQQQRVRDWEPPAPCRPRLAARAYWSLCLV